jgi:hypothetical protein
MCLRVSFKKEKKILFAFLKSLKKGVGSGVGSREGFGSNRGSGPPGPDTDLQPYPSTQRVFACFCRRAEQENARLKERLLKARFFNSLFLPA